MAKGAAEGELRADFPEPNEDHSRTQRNHTINTTVHTVGIVAVGQKVFNIERSPKLATLPYVVVLVQH